MTCYSSEAALYGLGGSQHVFFLVWLLCLQFQGHNSDTYLIHKKKEITYIILFHSFSNVYQNNSKIGSGFPQTSGQIHPTSRFSDWPN